MELTIAYLTFRLRPHFDWFCSSLARELRAAPLALDDVQVIVIDGRLWAEDGHRRFGLLDACHQHFRFEHRAPKPTIWQGPSRLTTRDYFCASNARNTALAYARGRHVAFVDDLSVLLPGWLQGHLFAAERGYVLAGTTSKQKEIVVDAEGNVVSYTPFGPGQDSRLKVFGPGLVRCDGGSLFGGTFSLPLELALRVNGQDEICDGIGGEDYDFGIRLQRAGAEIYYSKECGTFEDEDGHHAEAPMIRLDKPWPGPDGPYSSNHLLNKLLQEKDRSWTIGNDFSLRDLRASVLSGAEFPVRKSPTTHWVDGQLLSEM